MTPTQTEAGFLSAGQFAQVCGVNKQTLLYYEKLGLFAPCRRLENGCRYYSLDQIT